MTDRFLSDLASGLEPDAVRASDLDRLLYDHDASGLSGSLRAVCFPHDADGVRHAVRTCIEHDVPYVARGAGTGLAGGATPLDSALVISLTRLDRILEVDVADRFAWVEPGVLNLDLSRHTTATGSNGGFHFAPDPSSQQSCSIGGNVANNSGGPHCLLEGVTSAHVLACEIVTGDGEFALLDGDVGDLDLRGAFVGSEGMCGIATRIKVSLTPNPPHVATMLFGFASVDDGARCVSAIIAAGMVPAALEMMDRTCVRAVEEYIRAELPVDAAAVLLVETSGLRHQVAHDRDRIISIALEHRCSSTRIAADEAERQLLWKGRKTAFGAIARIKPNYYLNDTVVPRRALPAVLSRVYEIVERHGLMVMNVFHAGDGNLHPLIVFDKREPGVLERVHTAGAEIVRASIEAGGVLSGEHGIGIEKREFMPLMFGPDDLQAQADLRRSFDPRGLANPNKVLPSPSGCGDAAAVPDGAWI